MNRPDHRAQQVASAVQAVENPDFTILFGSRTRGDHCEGRSDIDLLLVQDVLPSQEGMEQATGRAEIEALRIYGASVRTLRE